jgi:Carboxypeptidase regulatory-like domain
MSCGGGPDCPAWCQCVNGICVPLEKQSNAVRLRTPDGRYLRGIPAPLGGLAASAATSNVWETVFRPVAPSTLPFASGDPLVIEVCDSDWGLSGLQIRTGATFIAGGEVGSYQFGGPDTALYVTGCCVSQAGYAGWPQEWTFSIETPGGGAIGDGDHISIATGDGFYFRVPDASDGALLIADAAAGGQADTTFIIELHQALAGLGLRPPDEEIKCDTCARVSGTVIDAATTQPIEWAVVFAEGPPPHRAFAAGVAPFDGTFTLRNADGWTCVPEGDWTLTTEATRYQIDTRSVTVVGGQDINMLTELVCTIVSGRVEAANGQGVAGAEVLLLSPDPPHHPVANYPSGGLLNAVTQADGTFSLVRVPWGGWHLWTDGASAVPISVVAAGLDGLILTISCGDVTGKVTNAVTGDPLAGAKVKVVGTPPGTHEATSAADSTFTITCVAPSGRHTLQATAVGFKRGIRGVDVPATGISALVEVKLVPHALRPPIARHARDA